MSMFLFYNLAEDRLKIEALSKAGLKPKEIGQLLGGRSERTIYRELQRGMVELLNSDLTTRKEYSADVAQQKHDYKGTAKGPGLKIANDYELVDFIEKEIKNEKKSPYAVAEEIKRGSKFKTKLCFKTIYNYIDQELFPTLTNKLIRRFIPKDSDIAEFSLRRIKMIENWINNYPRRIFNGLSANDLLKNKMSLNFTDILYCNLYFLSKFYFFLDNNTKNI